MTKESPIVSIYGQISNNTATTNGGGVYIEGTYTNDNSNGGFGVDWLCFKAIDCIISSNKATYGGGLYVKNINGGSVDDNFLERVILQGVTIKDNTSSYDFDGSALYCKGVSGIQLIGSTTISGVVSFDNGGGYHTSAPFYGTYQELFMVYKGQEWTNTGKITLYGRHTYEDESSFFVLKVYFPTGGITSSIRDTIFGYFNVHTSISSTYYISKDETSTRIWLNHY